MISPSSFKLSFHDSVSESYWLKETQGFFPEIIKIDAGNPRVVIKFKVGEAWAHHPYIFFDYSLILIVPVDKPLWSVVNTGHQSYGS